MVCLGNICRSPMAEGILQNKLASRKIKATVESMGTAAFHEGETPDRRAIETTKKYGIDISKHIGKQFQPSDFEKFDQIFVMDSSNYNDVINWDKDHKYKSKVDFIMNKAYPGHDYSVPDPYYGGQDGFENTFKMLDNACEKIADELENIR